MMFKFLQTNLFFRNKLIRANLILSVVLNLAMWVGLYFAVEPRVESIALRYTIYLGVDLIGPWWHVFVFPLIGLVLTLINSIIAYLVFIKVKLIAYFLTLATSIAQILLVLICMLIVLLNR